MAHILVTDDSTFLRRCTGTILKAAGHTIAEASNGVECLEQLSSGTFDLLFLDLVMPEMDGMAVLNTLKEAHDPIPVVVLTADIQESVRQECLQLGAAAFINKPPKEDEIRAALDTILATGDAS